MKNNGITEYFEEVETEKEYDRYFCRIPEIITIMIIGCMCGLKNVRQIHQWASNDRVSEFLKEEFGIGHMPCYYWILCMLQMIKTTTLNQCFVKRVYSFMPEKSKNLAISLDGKTIRSTNRIEKIENPLHIISAQVSEPGLTLAQRSTDDKSNEISAVQELLKELNIKGHIVVADALNCQKETAKIIVNQKADYLFCVKDNQPNLKKDIEDFIQDKMLENCLEIISKTEKNYGRIETRTACVTSDIDWLEQKKDWGNLCCIGAIHTEFQTKKGTSSEYGHYYISSRKLTAEQLLHHARMEWSVESKHWLLDVHFEEDWCLIENKEVQQHLNMFCKAAINLVKIFKSKTDCKKPISNIMSDCLIDFNSILRVVEQN